MRTNYKKIIEDRVRTIGRLTGYPITRTDAINQNSKAYLGVDTYNGYRLITIETENGGESFFSFRNNRCMGAADFVELLDGIIFGLEYKTKIEKEN